MNVLVHNERVLVGPMSWNRPMFEGGLDRLKISALLPRNDPETVPIVIDDATYLTTAQLVIPDHNSRTQTYYGPFWDFTNPAIAVGTFEIKYKQIWEIQAQLRDEAKANRYTAEVGGTHSVIQGKKVTIDTSREGRNIFVQKYSLMGTDETVNWKFPETWLTLTKDELGQCVAAGAAHIQATFDWEKLKDDEITASTTIEELEVLVVDNVPNLVSGG